MKKLYAISAVMMLFLAGSVMAGETTTTTTTTASAPAVETEVQKVAREKCEQQKLAGSLLEECVKAEVAKASETK